MRRRIQALASLSLALLSSIGLSAAITGGVPDGNGHPYVGWINGETATGVGTTGCSGVLAAPTVLLTSGACSELFLAALAPGGILAGGRVWVTFDPTDPDVIGGVFDPPNSPVSVEITQLVTNPAFLAAGGSATNPAPGNVAVAILAEAQPGPFADLPVAGRLDNLDGGEVFTAVAYGFEDRNSGLATLQRRFSGASLRAVSADSIVLRLTEGGGGPPACIGSQNEGGGGFIGASEAAALVLEDSAGGCNRVGELQRLDVQNVRDFLDDYVTLP